MADATAGLAVTARPGAITESPPAREALRLARCWRKMAPWLICRALAPVPGVLVDELPLYVLEDERETRHRLRQLRDGRARPVADAGPASAPAGGWWPAAQQQPLVPAGCRSMLVITRVIDLAPQLTMAALEDWWREGERPALAVRRA